MKSNSGIMRNKYSLYLESKKKMQRRKNRFKVMQKEQTQFTPRMSDNLLTEATSTNTSIESLDMITSTIKDFYLEARQKLTKVQQIQKKMTNLTKARLSSFKEKQNQRYDEHIAKLANQAINYLTQSQKLLKKIGNMQVNNESEKKMIKNMQISLAQQIRACSRSLRHQQRQYYNTIRQFESSSSNQAIQLTQEQRRMFQVSEELMEMEQTQTMENNKIKELVQSINKLSTIYKELNNLVIEQGSLIDRIDVNIEQTHQHTVNAVKHLEMANQHASSAFADKLIKVLVILIISMAFILGLKYMN